MISKKKALEIEAQMKRDARPSNNPSRPELSREHPVGNPVRGICRVCGCKVYRTETICGECLCEEDGLD